MDFTVIIPAKNEENNIQACLQSISNIDYSADKYEVLLIDNGSTDQTVEIAESFGAIVFVQPELTISGLRNFGARTANGRVLAFLDADCTVFPDWLNTASYWIDQKDICCFGCPPEVPFDATWVQKSWFLVREKLETIQDVDWLESMNMFVRKDVYDEIGGFDESLQTCEDYDLSLRLKNHGCIVSDRRIRAIHHGEASTVGHFYRKESWRGISNVKGMLRHGLHLREIPSLLVPFIYSFCAVLTLLLIFGAVLNIGNLTFEGILVWLLLWQTPILILPFYKRKDRPAAFLKLGLYILLNVYFVARTRAMLRISS